MKKTKLFMENSKNLEESNNERGEKKTVHFAEENQNSEEN